MKYLSLILIMLVSAACNQTARQPDGNKHVTKESSSGNFGREVIADDAVPANLITEKFTGSDTVTIKIFGNISSSCKHSGCWMNLDMSKGETIHVTFLDESFTIPLDAAGKNAIADGIAIRELIPVETLQNYAREEGKSDEEIAAITQPVYAYEFIASGVLIEE
jgi:hypothetical protein